MATDHLPRAQAASTWRRRAFLAAEILVLFLGVGGFHESRKAGSWLLAGGALVVGCALIAGLRRWERRRIAPTSSQ